MTIAQKKIELIQWITELEDENLVDSLADFRKNKREQSLPDPIKKLLELAKSTPDEKLIPHTSVRELLNRK
ncbi:hypothetical protein [Algoriphagus sp.]|uniref:hypothetical protein n=1 Tax=Algoriphagus sp. TaxID=1872435 RepID=UPI003282A789